MDSMITMDRSGRVVIPKSVRDALQLGPGDALELHASEGEITLTPARVLSHLAKEQGVWVYRSGTPVSREAANRLVEEARDDRIGELSR